jgi:protein-tyrosine phosphatase
MRPNVYWLDLPGSSRLAITSCPGAGDWLEDEIAGWRDEGIDVIVSLLEAEEIAELGLQREAVRSHELGIEFVSFPVPDGGVPATMGEAMALSAAIIMRLREGEGVGLHCRAGIGRSALIAACVLVLLGKAPGAAFDLIEKARGVKVPDTEGQRKWVAIFHETVTSEGIPRA